MLGVKTLFARVFKRQKKDRRFRLVQQFGAGNPNLSMGYGSYMSKTDIHCWRDGFSITVGRYCSLATNLTFILGGEHDINWVSTYRSLTTGIWPSCPISTPPSAEAT